MCSGRGGGGGEGVGEEEVDSLAELGQLTEEKRRLEAATRPEVGD